MKKIITLLATLFFCTLGQAYSLQRFINSFREVEGAKYKVFHRDSHFNDVPDNTFTPFSLKMRSGTLKIMGIEEMIILQVDSCGKRMRERFIDEISDAIPYDYSLIYDNTPYHIYMSNWDEEYAYMLIINYKLPGLTLMYVTNSFVRAMLNDAGDGFDPDKLGKHLEEGAEKFGESVINAGEKIKEGFMRLQKRAEEWSEESQKKDSYYF